MTTATAKIIASIINANRAEQWRLCRIGHPAWRLSTAQMMTWHRGRRVSLREVRAA
jgi:hypothetical protein